MLLVSADSTTACQLYGRALVLQGGLAYVLTQECILTDLVKQKAQLASHAQRRAELLRKRSEKEAETKATEAADKIAQFEQGSAIMPKKRKVENDQDTASSKKRTSDDSHVSKAATMPAFWLPSMAPEYEQDDEALLEEDRASITLCTASASHPHKLLSKQLVDVHFSERTVQNDKQVYCPCCKKECSRVSQTFGTLIYLTYFQSCVDVDMCFVHPAPRR
ncbi:hypothetical protein ACI68E_002566 [Malassezia pachydermatis]